MNAGRVSIQMLLPGWIRAEKNSKLFSRFSNVQKAPLIMWRKSSAAFLAPAFLIMFAR